MALGEVECQQINISRRLKQGDRLASFLFLLIAKGLSSLMQMAVLLDFFCGFKVGLEVVVSHHHSPICG
jgi:hypothetical protein